jgi:hypothetical protein
VNTPPIPREATALMTPANDTDDVAELRRAWTLLPQRHRLRFVALAQAVLALAAAPPRRRASVRAPAPSEPVDPSALLHARTLLRRAGVPT